MNHKLQKDFAERVRANQQKLSSELADRFDYIVCGAGTSGCVVAARLAADPKIQVLLLEAGGGDETDLITNPNHWPMTLGSELDWGFEAEANLHLNGRAIPYSMGKVLGGGSSINVSTWSRGHKADWDFYASEADDRSWTYDSVLDLYRDRVEAWTGEPDPDFRGTRGMVHVQSAADPQPFSFAFLDGAESVGLPRFPSVNGRMMETAGGCAFVDETVRDGKRRSIFRSYVYPLMDRRNITVLTGALARRVLFRRLRAKGIEFQYQEMILRAEAAHEVILCLGAIHTPKLLMQSGIGDEAELKRVGIPVRQVLPGVGRNLHDHLAFGCVWENTGKAPPPCTEKSGGLLLEDPSGAKCSQLFCLCASRAQCDTRECCSVQSSGRLLVPSDRDEAEKSRRCSPDRFRSGPSRDDRPKLPQRCRGPKGLGRRNKNCSRYWQFCCATSFHGAGDSAWLSRRGWNWKIFFATGSAPFGISLARQKWAEMLCRWSMAD